MVVAREDRLGTSGWWRITPASRQTAGARQERSRSGESCAAHLAARLPEYMVPAAYVRLETLPLTANGKLDRKALPAPEGDAYAVRGYEAPEGEMETTLAEIWAEVLKVERVGRHDNFFELGGHSLLAVRVMSRMRQALDVEVAISDLFAHPVLSDFARGVEECGASRSCRRLRGLNAAERIAVVVCAAAVVVSGADGGSERGLPHAVGLAAERRAGSSGSAAGTGSDRGAA